MIAEPLGRNTAPAIGLAAFLLLRENPDAVIGMFPSDHVIADEEIYRTTIERGAEIAAAGENIVVLGIRPNRAETGYGYIEAGKPFQGRCASRAPFHREAGRGEGRHVCGCGKLFLEQWNVFVERPHAGQSLREHLPEHRFLAGGNCRCLWDPKFAATFRKLYPKCENISVDYAVLEPRSAKGEQAGRIFCLPADFGWNDLGSWTALHEHHTAKSTPPEGNIIHGNGVFILNAQGNYVHAPGKFVAAVGVSDLVVVETADALLITTRQHAQDVGKVVKHLDEKKLHKLT